jgi:hypothetical protein
MCAGGGGGGGRCSGIEDTGRGKRNSREAKLKEEIKKSQGRRKVLKMVEAIENNRENQT